MLLGFERTLLDVLLHEASRAMLFTIADACLLSPPSRLTPICRDCSAVSATVSFFCGASMVPSVEARCSSNCEPGAPTSLSTFSFTGPSVLAPRLPGRRGP